MKTLLPELRMKERCATCAFRPGTEASQDATTQAAVYLCLQSATPFYCHEHVHTAPADETPLCAGFADALTKRVQQDAQKPEQAWRGEVASALLEMMEECPDDPETWFRIRLEQIGIGK